MPDDASSAALQRLASDLRERRRSRDLSDDDLRERLHVPKRLLSAFEEGRLGEEALFNRVYLRSLTRSYADASDVPSAVVLAALEDAYEGQYESGQLERDVTEYEKSEEERRREDEERRERARQEEEERQQRKKAEEEASSDPAAGTAAAAAGASDEPEPDWSSQSPPGASLDEAEAREREKEERGQERERERREREQEAERRREEREQAAAERQQGRTRDKKNAAASAGSGAAQSDTATEREDRPARRSRSRSRSRSNAGRWILGALVLAALALGAFFLIPTLTGDGEATETAQTAATAADTAAGGSQQQQDQGPSANLQLGEMVNFAVVAQGGPVRDLKVTRDQDVRRPYWIEQGAATVFPARQRIIIQNPPEGQPTLQNVRLLVEGYPYPTDRRDGQGRIVINREDLQTFADTLRGQPVQVPAQRDTAAVTGG